MICFVNRLIIEGFCCTSCAVLTLVMSTWTGLSVVKACAMVLPQYLWQQRCSSSHLVSSELFKKHVVLEEIVALYQKMATSLKCVSAQHDASGTFLTMQIIRGRRIYGVSLDDAIPLIWAPVDHVFVYCCAWNLFVSAHPGCGARVFNLGNLLHGCCFNLHLGNTEIWSNRIPVTFLMGLLWKFFTAFPNMVFSMFPNLELLTMKTTRAQRGLGL